MKVSREIYPCPECGGSGRIVYVGERNLHPVVRCKDCGYTEDSYLSERKYRKRERKNKKWLM